MDADETKWPVGLRGCAALLLDMSYRIQVTAQTMQKRAEELEASLAASNLALQSEFERRQEAERKLQQVEASLAAERERHKVDLALLQKEYDDAQQRWKGAEDQLTAQLHAVGRKAEEAEAGLASLQVTWVAECSRRQLLEEQMQELEQGSTSLAMERGALLLEFQKVQRDFRRARREWMDSLQQLTAELSTSRSKAVDLEARLEALATQLNDEAQKREATEHLLQALEETYAKAAMERGELAVDLQKAQHDFRRAWREWMETLQEMTAELSTARARAVDLEAQLDALSGRLYEETQRRESAEQSVETLEANKEELTKQNVSLTAELKALEHRCLEFAEMVTVEKSRAFEELTRFETVSGELQEETKRRRDAEQHLQELAERLAVERERLAATEKAVFELTAELGAANGKARELEANLFAMDYERQNEAQRRETVEQHLKVAEASNAELKRQQAEAVVNMQSMEREAQELAAELSAVKCRAMDVEARLEVLSSELQCESQKREAAERQLQEVKASAVDLTKERDGLAEELRTLQSQSAELSSKLKMAESILEDWDAGGEEKEPRMAPLLMVPDEAGAAKLALDGPPSATELLKARQELRAARQGWLQTSQDLISELNVAKGRALELEAKLEALRAELQEEGHRREAAEHVVQDLEHRNDELGDQLEESMEELKDFEGEFSQFWRRWRSLQDEFVAKITAADLPDAAMEAVNWKDVRRTLKSLVDAHVLLAADGDRCVAGLASLQQRFVKVKYPSRPSAPGSFSSFSFTVDQLNGPSELSFAAQLAKAAPAPARVCLVSCSPASPPATDPATVGASMRETLSSKPRKTFLAAFLRAVYVNPSHSILGLLQSTASALREEGNVRNPQFSANCRPDLDSPFRVKPNAEGRTRMLIVALQYRCQKLELWDSVPEARNAKRWLFFQGFSSEVEHWRILADDGNASCHPPTRANVLDGLRWLTGGSHAGDNLVFLFTGHGVPHKVAGSDREGTAILPLDHEEAGPITAE
eukprot:EG_transcript_1944